MSGHALLQKKKKKALMFLFEGVKRIVDFNTFFSLYGYLQRE